MNTKHIDLQSFGELEKYLYGGNDAFSYFNRDIKKCTPFTQIPIEITKSNGTANFGYTWSVVIDNNAGDYMLNSWLILELPEINLLDTNKYSNDGVIRWTENIMHNIIEECTLTFNETVVSKLDNFALDFLSEFNIKDNKYNEYMRNIGNVPEITLPTKKLSSRKLFLPLPLFFSKDTGNSIPLSALPHTEIRINIKFRNWEQLLILENKTFIDPKPEVPLSEKDIKETPLIKSCKLFGTFVTVSEEERKKIGVKNKFMVIEQIQTSPRQMISEENSKIDLLFKQSIKTLYFAVRNTTFKNVWSNYTKTHDKYVGGLFIKNPSEAIIETASIKYNDKERVCDMPVEYFKFVNPWYHSERTPSKEGMYSYSYALSQESTDPSGGVSISKIDNPSLNIKLYEGIKQNKDNFELIVLAVSNNIIRISDGVVHFPII